MSYIESRLNDYCINLLNDSGLAADFISQDEIRLQLMDALELPAIIGTSDRRPIAYFSENGELTKLTPLSNFMATNEMILGSFNIGGYDFKFAQGVEIPLSHDAFDVQSMLNIDSNVTDILQSAFEFLGFQPGPFLDVVALQVYQVIVDKREDFSVEAAAREILLTIKDKVADI